MNYNNSKSAADSYTAGMRCTESAEDIIDYRSLWIDYATPRMVIGYKEILNTLFSYIMDIDNLYCIGRQGLFSYMNADQCIKLSFDLCNSLKNNKAKIWQRHLLKILHNFDLAGERK
ncbi:MAG: hypothetical protein ABII23_00475 [bacterium]